MRHFTVGLFFVLHGLAHVAAGMAAQDAPHGIALSLGSDPSLVLATTLFATATTGFVAAGFGRWGVVGIERCWAPLTRVASVASVLLLLLFSRSGTETVCGLGLDAVALAIAGLREPLAAAQRPLGSA